MTRRVPEDAPERVGGHTSRRVLVTGAASGLGAALTAAFRARGDDVLATDLAGSDGFETGLRPSSTTEGPGLRPSSTTGGPGLRPSSTTGGPGLRPSSTTEGPGLRASSTTEGPGLRPSSTTGGPGLRPSSTTERPVVEEVAQQPSRNHPAARLDITSDDDWAAALAWVEEEWGGLDILVNNAGVAGGGRIDVAGLDEWEWITGINLFGVVRGCRTFTPMFKRQRSGRIVNVASLAGLVHPAGMAAYNAVKAGVVALTETLGHELAPYGVGASVVCPSYFRTNLLSSMRGADTALAGVVSHLVESSPISADQIAAAVLAGIDAGDELILPDPAARAAYDLKLGNRPAYDAQMRHQAEALDKIR